MIFAVILAGGTGTRLKSSNTPKQFLVVEHKSILQLTLEKFIRANIFDKIVIALPKAWISYTKDLLRSEDFKSIDFCIGGATRQESLYNAVKYIDKSYKTSDSCIIVSHDAARPFVSLRIIHDNINMTLEVGAADTVIPCTDTIVTSTDGLYVDSIPNRANLYQGQTPQSFLLKQFLNVYTMTGKNELDIMTDAIKILRHHKIPVGLVQGEPQNIKITNDYDMRLMQFILQGNNHD